MLSPTISQFLFTTSLLFSSLLSNPYLLFHFGPSLPLSSTLIPSPSYTFLSCIVPSLSPSTSPLLSSLLPPALALPCCNYQIWSMCDYCLSCQPPLSQSNHHLKFQLSDDLLTHRHHSCNYKYYDIILRENFAICLIRIRSTDVPR